MFYVKISITPVSISKCKNILARHSFQDFEPWLEIKTKKAQKAKTCILMVHICLIMWLKSLFYMKLFFSQFSFSSYHSLILTPTRSFFPFGHSMSFVLQIPHRVPPKVVCCLAPRGVREHRGCLRVQLQLVGQRVHKVSRPDLGQPQRKQKNRFHRYAKQVRSFIMKTK